LNSSPSLEKRRGGVPSLFKRGKKGEFVLIKKKLFIKKDLKE